ncbi:MAG: protein-glutamate O-methyltransferase CheR [Elusimicrobia bacterium]|nr:protein-glutamate O-methyltransferase CheR [Elusimicrobiota bacterium]
MATLLAPEDLEKLKRHLVDTRGLDLSQYSDAFLERRLLARMGHNQIGTFKDYMGLLAKTPVEYQKLIDSLTINVTGFFRDNELSEKTLNPIFDGLWSRSGTQIRPMVIWSAGCATGQEPYTVAMVVDSYVTQRASLGLKYQILATDFNEEQLKAARPGLYPKAAMSAVPAHYRSKYLRDHGDKVQVADSLVKKVQFKRHDLATHPPIDHIDLILCRNVMIYFTTPAKNQILHRFHRCLTPRGILILGASEIVLLHGIFKTVDREHKIYTKIDSDQEVS